MELQFSERTAMQRQCSSLVTVECQRGPGQVTAGSVESSEPSQNACVRGKQRQDEHNQIQSWCDCVPGSHESARDGIRITTSRISARARAAVE